MAVTVIQCWLLSEQWGQVCSRLGWLRVRGRLSVGAFTAATMAAIMGPETDATGRRFWLLNDRNHEGLSVRACSRVSI